MKVVPNDNRTAAGTAGFAVLLPVLRRLDQLLARLVHELQPAAGAEAASFRGLYISPEEAADLLARAPGVPTLGAGGTGTGLSLELLVRSSPAGRVGELFGLSPFDFDVAIVALAPELDLRYKRLYAYLQDDVTRRRPSVDLALNLLCRSAEEKVARRANFASGGPLLKHGLLHLVADPNHVRPPLLAHYLKLDDQFVRVLLDERGPDPRLATWCRAIDPESTPGGLADAPASGMPGALRSLAEQARTAGRSLRLYFRGPAGAGKLRAASALAGNLGAPLLVADLRRADGGPDFEPAVGTLFREALLTGAILYLDHTEALRRGDRAAHWRSLLGAVAAHRGIAILAGDYPWPSGQHPSPDVVHVEFTPPDFAARRECWRSGLAEAGVQAAPGDTEDLAGRFRLTTGQIEDAVTAACNQARWRAACTPAGAKGASAAPAPAPTAAELFAAARAQCGPELASLARKVESKQTWADIVLPPDQLAHLREIRDQATFRHHVYGEWGFGRKLSLGTGLNVLFAGPPGTGKTMAAEVIASDLRLDLYKIDLSQVVSKYIGETEKNLDRVFAAAESSNAILFFDEADALFGKRSEVKDAHDRYANIEIGYLLQKMEEYEGIAILATNLRQNLDDAFVRRLHIVVEFPFPDEKYRRRIWEVTFPHAAPLGPDVDFAVLGREVKLAGGHIKNIALTAAFYAAVDGGEIGMTHLARAAHREHQKLGRAWDERVLSAQRS